jgi:hypothetical protein
MSTPSVNPLVARLAQPGPLSVERFAAVLGAALQPAESNPAWSFYTFQLPQGPFAGGELRLNQSATGALLSLEPREPPGLGAADVDVSAWGPRLSVMPNPRIPPEGADTEVFALNGVRLSAQWWHTSGRLRRLVLEWAPPAAPATP